MLNVCDKPLIFSGTSHLSLAKEIASFLSANLGKITIQQFPDGEINLQIQENVNNCDVFAFQSIALNPNYYLIELLMMIDSLKRGGARCITAIIPYFGYSRQDRQDKPGVPITAKLVADMLTQAGATKILTMDLHAGQLQGFFNIPVDNLFGSPNLVKAFKKLCQEEVIVVAPDMGSAKRARSYAKQLNVQMAFIEKQRDTAQDVETLSVTGNIKGKNVLLADDMCSTAGTLVSAAKACREKGALRIFAVATHGLLVGDAIEKIEQSPIEALLISNTICVPQKILQCCKIQLISIADIFGQAIQATFAKEQ